MGKDRTGGGDRCGFRQNLAEGSFCLNLHGRSAVEVMPLLQPPWTGQGPRASTPVSHRLRTLGCAGRAGVSTPQLGKAAVRACGQSTYRRYFLEATSHGSTKDVVYTVMPTIPTGEIRDGTGQVPCFPPLDLPSFFWGEVERVLFHFHRLELGGVF